MKLLIIIILQFIFLNTFAVASTPHLLCENHIKKETRVRIFCDQNMIVSTLPESLRDLEKTNLKSHCSSLKEALGEGEDLADIDLGGDFGMGEGMDLEFGMDLGSAMDEGSTFSDRSSLNNKNFIKNRISERENEALCQCKTSLGKGNLCSDNDKDKVKNQMENLVTPLKKARTFRALSDLFDLQASQALYQFEGKVCGGELESTISSMSCADEVFNEFQLTCKAKNTLLGSKEKKHCTESKNILQILTFPKLAKDEALLPKLNFSTDQGNFIRESFDRHKVDGGFETELSEMSRSDFKLELMKINQDSTKSINRFIDLIKKGNSLAEAIKQYLPSSVKVNHESLAKDFFIFDKKSNLRELNWLKIHLIADPLFSDYFYKGNDRESYNLKYKQIKRKEFNRLIDRIKNDNSKEGLKELQKEDIKLKMADQCRGVIKNLKELCSYDEMSAFKELKGAVNENQLGDTLNLLRDNKILKQNEELDPFYSAYRSLYCSIKNVNFDEIDPAGIYQADDENSCNSIYCPIEKKDLARRGSVVEKKVKEGKDAIDELEDIEDDLASSGNDETRRNRLKKRLKKVKMANGQTLDFNGNSVADMREAIQKAKGSWKSWSGKKIENHKKEIDALIDQASKMKANPDKYTQKQKDEFKDILDDHFSYSDELQDAGLYDFDKDLENSLNRLQDQRDAIYPETKRKKPKAMSRRGSNKNNTPTGNAPATSSAGTNSNASAGAGTSTNTVAAPASSAPAKKAAAKAPSSGAISSPTDTARTYKVNNDRQVGDLLNDEDKPTFKAFFDQEKVEMVLHKLNDENEYEEIGKYSRKEFYNKKDIFHETIQDDGEKFFSEFGNKSKKLKTVLEEAKKI